jgi:hypothetical protein
MAIEVAITYLHMLVQDLATLVQEYAVRYFNHPFL